MLVILQMLLILTLAAMEQTLFYILFEATVISTLIIITQWSNQIEHLKAEPSHFIP